MKLLLPLIILTSGLITDDYIFDTDCLSCKRHFTNDVVTINKTNRIEPLMEGKNGYTNLYIDLLVSCTNCLQTNHYEWEYMVHNPQVSATKKIHLPPREVPPPLPMATNIPSPHTIIINIPK